MKIPQILFFVSLLIIFISCSNQKKNKLNSDAIKPTVTTQSTTIINAVRTKISKDSIFSNDYSFYADSILHSHKILLSFFIRRYNSDSCVPMIYKKEDLKTGFEGFKNLGDLNNNKKADSVFILDPLNWCEYDSGQSYYFTDTSLPRLPSGSYCCHPTNFFKAPDIDEDGIAEVGFYYSSCVSRYKSIHIYKLRNKQWEEIGVGEFDIMTQDPTKVKLEDLVEKIAKNKFRVRNFFEDKKYWDTLLIKN